MKKIVLLVIVAFIYAVPFAQNASIKGLTTDTSSKQNLSHTVVSLLRAKDSILVKFTRTDARGEFKFTNLKAGDYILFVTYPEYADYAEQIKLTDTSNINTGTLSLILKAHLLQDVVVKQKIGAMRMKGDTTEFVADSFKVQPNATVEDLLKKIPSIQIDKDGKITAEGQTVKKVLVDGEEFFGDDPTLVTQNLRADMVGTVQIYDKKSDQAAFTGIDDGQKDKTINLKLKDGKKNGYFGKLNVGAGTNGFHDNQLMFNAFKNKKKFAAYGFVSNTGKTGLNWQDNNNYGDQGSGMEMMDDGGMMMFIGSGGDDDIDGWNGQYSGQGYPLVQTGGLHYNNRFGNDKQSINGNYKILNFMVNGNSTTNSQYILSQDSLTYTNSFSRFKNSILRHRANGTYEAQFDSSTSIKITADGGNDHKITSTFDSSESHTDDGQRLNHSTRNLAATSDKSTVNSNILFRKKFKKVGRTLSFNLKETYSNSQSAGYLYSAVDTFKNNVFAGTGITDQYKIFNSRNVMFDTKLTYTEPLSKTSSLIFNYGVVIDNSNSERNSFNKNTGGKYTQLDTVYSNHYKFDMFTNRGGVNYNFNKKKIRFNFGGNLGFTNFTQTDLNKSTAIKRNFVNYYPQASFTYSFTQQRRLYLSYNGNTSQPSIQQIQPVPTNDDPLNVYEGNPNLKPAFNNRFGLNFNDFKVLTSRSIFMGANYNFTSNAIVNSSTVDAYNKRVNKYINLNGNQSLNGYIYYGLKLKKLDAYLNFNGNVNSSKYNSVINGVLNTTKSGSYTGGFNFYKEKEKKFSVSLNASATYTTSTSSIQVGAKLQYWTYQLGPNFDVYLPWKFQLHGEADYNIRPAAGVLPANNAFILNGWFGKKLLKNDALVIKVSGNDILNQNIGFTRSVQSNFITQTTNSTIGRYFLLSAVWNFTKAGTTAPRQNF